jgi:hypothetical protein
MITYKIVYTDGSSRVQEKTTTLRQEAENIIHATETLNYRNVSIMEQRERDGEWIDVTGEFGGGPQLLNG